MNKKTGFVLHFDTCQQIKTLPNDQLGMLFLALMECARLESEGKDGTADFEQRYPAMTSATQMAFLFIAATIHRDSRAYAEKCANYQAAAQRRAEARRAQQAVPSESGTNHFQKLWDDLQAQIAADREARLQEIDDI